MCPAAGRREGVKCEKFKEREREKVKGLVVGCLKNPLRLAAARVGPVGNCFVEKSRN